LKIVYKKLFWDFVKSGKEKENKVVRKATIQNALSHKVENYPILKMDLFRAEVV